MHILYLVLWLKVMLHVCVISNSDGTVPGWYRCRGRSFCRVERKPVWCEPEWIPVGKGSRTSWVALQGTDPGDLYLGRSRPDRPILSWATADEIGWKITTNFWWNQLFQSRYRVKYLSRFLWAVAQTVTSLNVSKRSEFSGCNLTSIQLTELQKFLPFHPRRQTRFTLTLTSTGSERFMPQS